MFRPRELSKSPTSFFLIFDTGWCVLLMMALGNWES